MAINAFWTPHALVPNDQGIGTTKFVCVADVEDARGQRSTCCNTIVEGVCARQHVARPKPFTQRIADGEHLPKIVRVARPYYYSTEHATAR